MLYKKFNGIAQAVGYATLGLLAIYGLLTLLGSVPAVAKAGAALGLKAADAPVISPTFNYQGFLRNPDGSLATDVYTITAKIYDTLVAGSTLYTETFPNVTVRDGLFNVVLGDGPRGQDLQSVFSATPRYIGITLVGQGDELSPRQRLHAVPWAMWATRAMTATTLVPNATVNGLNGLTVNGDATVTGKVTSAPTASGDISTTVTTKDYVDTKWPDGHYCILRSGGSCPSGFSPGVIGFDTEDTDNADFFSGTWGDTYDYGHTHSRAVPVCCK